VKILLLAAFTSLSVFAHDLRFGSYLKMQEALANDDMKTALEAHGLLCEKELLHYKDDYKDCGKKFDKIEDLRTSFKKLSEVYLANGAKAELKNLTKASCPMAKAKWVQRNGGLKNPYYGKSMLDCGEKI